MKEKLLISNCAVCDTKNSILVKEHKATGLLSTLRITALLSQICLVGPFLF